MNGEASSSTLVEDLAFNHKEIKTNKINDNLEGKQNNKEVLFIDKNNVLPG
jgi:hypothetical protein